MNKEFALPARQVHLDFHTSEHIKDVGRRFSEKQFQAALKLGHVNSITVFAKCHHSWSYYPTRVGRRHPHLKTDLLGRQIKACHDIGVRAPIYYTVGWSANDAADHPEWAVRDKAGNIDGFSLTPNARPTDPMPPFAWVHLCPSGEYLAHMAAQVEEICRLYDVDGFFFDICFVLTCRCANCMKGMKAVSLDPASDADVRTWNIRKWVTFMTRINQIIQARHPEATIFYNGLANIDLPAEIHACQTHFELEDLPTTWGGYDRFPARAKCFQTFGKNMLAMSGKFHTAWGEFGGFKHPDAIRFEAASMIASGARCSFGDQLHPSGEMDLATYRNIGQAYKYVQKIEDYGLDGKAVSNLGVWPSASPTMTTATGPAAGSHDQGVANMLLEAQLDWEIVLATHNDLARFQTIILTGDACLNQDAAAKLNDYVRKGGSLLLLGESSLDPARRKLLFDVGARYAGPAKFSMDYTLAGDEMAEDVPASPFLNYTPAPRFCATDGTVLARIREPYFDRTCGRYCSHQNTPYTLSDAKHVAAIQKGRIICLPHPLGRIYAENGARVHRQFFLNALGRLYKRPMLSVSGMPSIGRVNLVHQPQHNRYVVHLTYAPPLQRGRCLVIEDMPTIRDVQLTLRLPEKISQVALPLTGKILKPGRKGSALTVRVPEVSGHQIVVLQT